MSLGDPLELSPLRHLHEVVQATRAARNLAFRQYAELRTDAAERAYRAHEAEYIIALESFAAVARLRLTEETARSEGVDVDLVAKMAETAARLSAGATIHDIHALARKRRKAGR